MRSYTMYKVFQKSSSLDQHVGESWFNVKKKSANRIVFTVRNELIFSEKSRYVGCLKNSRKSDPVGSLLQAKS